MATAALAAPNIRPGGIVHDSGTRYSCTAKGQAKLAFVDGAWWGVLATAQGLVFTRLDQVQGVWTRPDFPGSRVTSDPESRADVLWTGQHLLVLANEHLNGRMGLRLHVYAYERPAFRLLPGYPVTVVSGVYPDTIAQDVETLAVDSNVVAFDRKVGVFWADQRAGTLNAFRFRWREDDASRHAGLGAWAPEEVVQGTGENLADNHMSIQCFEHRVFVVVKTNLNTVGRDVFTLYVRGLDETWTVLGNDGSVQTQSATRPILVIDKHRRRLHVLWNGGGVMDASASVDAPVFGSKTVVIHTSEGTWNTQATHQHVDDQSGLVVVADDPKST